MKWLVLIVLTLAGVGCSSTGTISGASSRHFDTAFEEVDAKVREIYPPVLVPATIRDGDQKLTIKRDELSRDRQVMIVLQAIPAEAGRTTILLDGNVASGCNVSVQVSKSKKSVLLPVRDEEQEKAVLDNIAEALNKK